MRTNLNTLKEIGEYRQYSVCRFCFGRNLYPIVNLGMVPLAGGFLQSTEDFKKERFFPLEISFCENCYLVQSINVINAPTLFENYFYHSSAIGTLSDHFKTIAAEIADSITKQRENLVVEIGCNDGVLIQELLKKNVNAYGVDPARNIVQPLIKKGLPIINDYFSENLAKKIKKEYGKADVIASFNVMAHIEDMHDIAKGIKLLLKKNGYLMFETHYLGKILNELQYDMIYHEHQYYYSLLTLEKFFAQFEMEIFDVKPIQIHAGSMRYYVQHKNAKRKISPRVAKLHAQEKKLKFHRPETYEKFSKKIAGTKKSLIRLLTHLKKENKKIAGYGASGRGTIIMNYCGLDKNYLEYVIDDAPAKQHSYTPGTHLKIVSSTILLSRKRPDYTVLFAWSFFKEIQMRNKKYSEGGGVFITPLPKVKIIKK